MNTDTEPLYSCADLRKIFQIDETTWSKWRATGKGPAYEINNGHVGAWRTGVSPPKFFYRHSALLEFTGGRWPKDGRFVKNREAAKLCCTTLAAICKRRYRGRPPAPVYLEGCRRYLPEDCVPNYLQNKS